MEASLLGVAKSTYQYYNEFQPLKERIFIWGQFYLVLGILPSTTEVYRHSNWNTLTLYYKLRLTKLLHNVFIGEVPTALSYLTIKPCTAYNLRRSNNIIVPRFNSQFLKNSISYRGAILWNAVSSHFTDQFTVFHPKVKKDSYFKELDFSAQSVQSLPRHYQDFKCF